MKSVRPSKGEAASQSANKTEQLILLEQEKAAERAPHADDVSALPLFFKKPQALDSKRHASAAIRPSPNYQFAARTNAIPLNAIEFIEAVKYFPIVFTTAEKPAPIAIMGFEQQNYFVSQDGQWKAPGYVPAYVRQYPFIFFERAGDANMLLCIDEASESYLEKGGKGAAALFADDAPTEATKNALQFCTSFYNHHKITQNFCEDLKKHDLLVPCQSDVQLQSGKTFSLNGFMMIDEQRFNNLSDEVYLEFRRKGWIAFIYLTLASSSNWKHLVDYADKSA